MYSNSKSAKAVRLAMMFGAGAAATISTQAISAEDSAEDVERIEVTGSRIKRADMEGANPVQIITREDLVTSGITNMGDILQEIPSVAGAATNTAINNGGSGAIRVSLRGLGSSRTLVLLNGRRIVASGTGADSSVDLSTIPTAIVKRVEVLKDGASAIYGSDAIGGVVNIITRDDFEGAEFNASYDVGTEEWDGDTKSIDFTFGFSGDKGNAVINAYYVQQKSQFSGDRDWSAFELDLNPYTGELDKGGSSAPPWGRYNGVNSANPANFTQLRLNDDGTPDLDDAGNQQFDLPTGTCNSFTHGAGSGPGQSDPTDFSNSTGFDCWDWGKDTYNYAPANYHLTPQERYGMFASGSYELTDSVRFFTEMNFNRRTSKTKLAPIPLAPLAFFGQTATYTAGNYYNQQFGPKDMNGDTVDIADWRRRVVETGGRNTEYRVETVRAMFGFDGEFDNGWGWEASYVFGRNDAATNAAGGVNFDKVKLAVGDSFMDDQGNVVCGTVDAPIAGCVSLNTFGTPGTDSEISQDMLNYISFEAHDLGGNEQQIMSASIYGDAFELPAGTVGFAAGIEHREEKGFDYPDALIALGVTSGSTREATAGSYTVDEAFFEANLPLLSGAPFAEVLEVDIAVRYSDYDTFGDTTNHKIGVRWMPVDGLMVRGTSSTAFRAPSTNDLFQGASANSPSVVDPCNSNPTPFCIADGVPAAGFEPIGDQLSSTRGGSTEIQPEEADIFTAGIVYSPDFVDGLSLTIDYWDIEITDAISTIGEQLILTKCANEGIYCDKIVRYGADSPLYGNSSDIDDRTTNVGGVNSSGYDFNIRYTTDLDIGTLTVNVDTTYYDTYDIIQADGSIVENAGAYYENGGDGNFPEWKSNINLSLRSDDWSAGWSIRYIGEVEELWANESVADIAASDNGLFPAFKTQAVTNASGEITSYDLYRDVDSQIIHDARFTYFMDNMTATIGLNNVFDEEPPYAATGFNDNTDPRTYNTTGRHVYVTVGMTF
jgi:outer membrane receptor protein involved in Fe transport